MFHNRKTITFLFLILLGTLLLLSGCTTSSKNMPIIELLPGESAVRTKVFRFYIGSNEQSSEDQKIVPLPADLLPHLIADPVWSLPQGVELISSTISLEPSFIEWDGGNMKYSTDSAARLLIEYEVSAASSAIAEDGEISITFEILNAYKGDNVFWVASGSWPEAKSGGEWQLNEVVMFTDAADKQAAKTKVIGTWVGGLIMLGVFIIGSIWLNEKY